MALFPQERIAPTDDQGIVRIRLDAPALHRPRQWGAMGDLLGSDFLLAELHRLCEVHDHLLAHKAALFSHLQERWRDLFNAKFEVLLYDLTSTYFEIDPPFPGTRSVRNAGY